MFPAYQTLLVAPVAEHVLQITLNRPHVANAIDTQMGRDLVDAWSRLAHDPQGTRCVVLTGAGTRALRGGGDLKERDGMTTAQWQAQHAIFEHARQLLLDCRMPVIAAVNGHAFAGGCELVLACDFAYAVRGARFALTEVTLGIMPGMGGTQFLPRAVGERRAMEIILTGQPFGAEQALEWGIVNRLCDDIAQLHADVRATAERIAANAPLSVMQAKKSIRSGMQMDLATGLQFEIEAYHRLTTTQDRLEGVRAYNEKRRPNFIGQ